ncbi:MAG: glycoside hydrolase family 16 protein [Candidatus Cyclobacteriaceae bacterium M2_1C_046]
MKINIYIVLIVVVLGACSSVAETNEANWKLVWSDEFEYQGQPEESKWTYDLGNGCPTLCGWGNNELQTYTRNSENVRVEDGKLHIIARKDNENNYTSTRIKSLLKGDWKYGLIEVSAKLPYGKGTWSAIWMLPTDWRYGDWPKSGEIDIMEHVGFDPGNIHGTIHTEAFNHIKGTHQGDSMKVKDADQAFHKYSIQWSDDKIEFMIDDKIYNTFRDNGDGPSAWPFDEPFHLIMNIAVGGNWGGKYGVNPDVFPQIMEIDYVRVYQKVQN